ncbi:hypothetical protein ANO11243_027380 [Dothideomycetidae sp. 11243]|nr:hypothetical protein ANO11243_027380 [fungal sp. No.11243]
MRPTTIITTVFAAFVTQGEITGAVPLKGESGGPDYTLGSGPEHHALMERDAAALLDKRNALTGVEIAQLALGCITAGSSVTLLIWKHMDSRKKEKICTCGAKVINKAKKAAGKQKIVDEEAVDHGFTTGLETLKEVTGTGADLIGKASGSG